MADPHSPDLNPSCPAPVGRSWPRRAALLGALATGLVLLGDRTVAGGVDGLAGQARAADPAGSLMALFTGFALTAHEGAVTMSEGAFEAASLFALGLTLLGAERLLSRARRHRERALDAHASPGASAAEIAAVTAPALAGGSTPIRHRAAR